MIVCLAPLEREKSANSSDSQRTDDPLTLHCDQVSLPSKWLTANGGVLSFSANFACKVPQNCSSNIPGAAYGAVLMPIRFGSKSADTPGTEAGRSKSVVSPQNENASKEPREMLTPTKLLTANGHDGTITGTRGDQVVTEAPLGRDEFDLSNVCFSAPSNTDHAVASGCRYSALIPDVLAVMVLDLTLVVTLCLAFFCG